MTVIPEFATANIRDPRPAVRGPGSRLYARSRSGRDDNCSFSRVQ
jgi:hypothetical protein